MNKQRLLIIIGIILAVGSAWIMNRYAAELDKKEPVVVAKKSIKQLDTLSPDNLEVIQMPPRYILPGAYTSIEQVTGKASGVKLFRGEQIIQDKIAQDQVSISANERLLFIPCKSVLMEPNQKVDLYLVYQPGKSEKSGCQIILKEKTIANVLDERGHSIYGNTKDGQELSRGQAGIEIIVTQEEIAHYLNELLYAKETVVRYGERVIR